MDFVSVESIVRKRFGLWLEERGMVLDDVSSRFAQVAHDEVVVPANAETGLSLPVWERVTSTVVEWVIIDGMKFEHVILRGSIDELMTGVGPVEGSSVTGDFASVLHERDKYQ